MCGNETFAFPFSILVIHHTCIVTPYINVPCSCDGNGVVQPRKYFHYCSRIRLVRVYLFSAKRKKKHNNIKKNKKVSESTDKKNKTKQILGKKGEVTLFLYSL